MSTHSSPLPACFRPTTSDDHHPTAAPPPPTPPSADSTNLTTCLYQTHIGLFSLTWSRTLFGRSLHLHLHHHHHTSATSPLPLSLPSSPTSSSFSSSLSFHLHIKPFIFWKKHGSKKLNSSTQIFYDLTRAKFGAGPEPMSGFYIAVVVDGEMALLVGDSIKEAYSKTKARKPKKAQFMFLRREHLFGNRVYSTTAHVGGQKKEISIECSMNGDGRLWFGIDKRKVLQVKRLKWKFRGNERVEIDGVPINISWDVYNWMFDDLSSNDGHAVFMFRFEKLLGFGEERLEDYNFDGLENYSSFGMNEIELRKMRKSMLRTTRSSSSSSISSSASSGGGSSVMEWASSEDNDLCGPIGFSLLVYAWKR
ncbi:uncharacterized protein LOC116189318 [Punica granatum]|uniref:Uncharacterized protein LOC116189318 n=1 Tax=Punica granatum TaxID=22663 RepID=A0A6P8BYX5_PUNGR|nr:uncharacterized protein LOC116189318 [Punica granatum]